MIDRLCHNRKLPITGLSELFQVGGCDEKVGGCKSRRGKTLGASGGMPTGKFLNLESLK